MHDPTVLNAILSLVEHEEKRAVYPPRDKSSTNEDILPRHEQVLERERRFSLACLQDFNDTSNRWMLFVCPANLNSTFGGLASWELLISIIVL